jgi:hypothetical protein
MLLVGVVCGGMGGSGNMAGMLTVSKNEVLKPSCSSSVLISMPLECQEHFQLWRGQCSDIGFPEGEEYCRELTCSNWNVSQMKSGTDGSEGIHDAGSTFSCNPPGSHCFNAEG